MRILMLADLSEPSSRALAAARALATCGHGVELLAPDHGDPATPLVTFVPDHPPVISSWDQIAGGLQRDLALLERGLLRAQDASFDVIDARGWRTAHAAAGLREACGIPLVASFDSVRRVLRRGRRWTRVDELADETERWLAASADAVIVRSAAAARALADAASCEVVAGAGKHSVSRLERVYRTAIARAERPVHAVSGA